MKKLRRNNEATLNTISNSGDWNLMNNIGTLKTAVEITQTKMKLLRR
jgi:hypothetical protein